MMSFFHDPQSDMIKQDPTNEVMLGKVKIEPHYEE